MGISSALGGYVPPGLVLLESGSFSTASSKSISKFSSSYKHYQMWVDITSVSATSTLYVRLRSGSTDATGTDYYGFAKGDAASLTSTDNYAGSGVSYYPIAGMYNGSFHVNARIDIYAPYDSVKTNFSHQGYGFTTGGGNIVYYGGCQHNLANSYDGITILPASGTFTGSYALYGLRN